MRICLIGKFPPIQGGVSMRTYRIAHALAARGHDVHVVTNAREAAPPFRMHMRAEDWPRCAARYDAGAVTVHWTEPADRRQAYIPMASPFVSKLAGLALDCHRQHAFDVILSYYLEPYGVAGSLVSQATGVPHVVRMAGSDAGRLWQHPQLEPLYDHVLGSAAAVLTAGAVARRAIGRGVARDRIVATGGVVLPETLFTPDGPALDLAALRAEITDDPETRDQLWGGFTGDRPYVGIYGKLGDTKGTFALLAALRRVVDSGVDIGLVALAHGPPEVERRFRTRVARAGLTGRVLQLPFLPHWRVPDFIRGCVAVCCLEQGFPIAFHDPVVAREVLLCGGVLIGSTEVIGKLPGHTAIPSGYGCLALADVDDADALARTLRRAATAPDDLIALRARGCAFARDLQSAMDFPGVLEQTLAAAAQRQPMPSALVGVPDESVADDRFRLTALVAQAIGAPAPIDRTAAGAVLAVLEAPDRGVAAPAGYAAAVRLELAIADAEAALDARAPMPDADPIFRLQSRRAITTDDDIARLVPVCAPDLRLLAFDIDVTAFQDVHRAADLPTRLAPARSTMVVFGAEPDGRRDPIVIDAVTAEILTLSDGTRTAQALIEHLTRADPPTGTADHVAWIEHLFTRGLIGLRDPAVS